MVGQHKHCLHCGVAIAIDAAESLCSFCGNLQRLMLSALNKKKEESAPH